MAEPTDRAESAERIRLIVDTEEVLRRAVRLRAAKSGCSPSDVVNGLIREHLREEVSEAKRYLDGDGKRKR